MKKLIALLMTLVLLGSVAAAEKETFTFDDANPGYEGAWIEEKEAGFRLYLPADFDPNTTLDNMIPDTTGFVKIYMSKDTMSTLSVSTSPLALEGGMPAPTLDSMLSLYEQLGDPASIITINGTDWIYTRNDEIGSITLVTLSNDTVYTLSFLLTAPGDNKDKLLEAGEKVIRSVTLIKE